jgi:uncharacterized protein YcbK (DUF882 family)
MINDIRVSPHFRLREFQCRCCGVVKLSPELLDMLEEMREAWGGPLVITSGYRCPAHNRAVGGAPRSLHLSGAAADISANRKDQELLFNIARNAGFAEVICGGKKQYVHVGYKNSTKL